MKNALVALALCAAAATAPARASVVGTADTVSSFPFGSYLGGYYYQQIYSAANFASTTSIRNLTFYDSYIPDYANGTPSVGTFDLYLSTSRADIATFDTSTTIPFADPSYTLVYSGSVPALAAGKLVFTLTTPFAYNSADGNLLLTVFNRNLNAGATLYLNADRNVGVTNMRTSSYPYDYNQGLVTGFNEAAAAVPEPGTWAMLVLGMGAVGHAMRRRARVTAAVRFA